MIKNIMLIKFNHISNKCLDYPKFPNYDKISYKIMKKGNNAMNFNMEPPMSSPDMQKQLDQAYKNRQLEINASKIQLESTAEQVAIHILNEIQKYQSNLSDTEDVAMKLVQFSQSITILVQGIGYSGYNLVCFHGRDTEGKPMELIQHVQQLNFLLMVMPKPEPDIPKRKIGFVGQID